MYFLTVSQPPHMNQYHWTQITVLASPSFWWLYRSLKEMKVLVTQSCLTLCHPWTVAHQLLCPWDFPGKNVGVGCYSLLQGIFLTQGFNLGLLHCRQILYHLTHQGSPFLGLWPNHSSFQSQHLHIFKASICKPLCFHVAFSFVCVNCFPFIRTLEIVFRTYSDNSRQYPL